MGGSKSQYAAVEFDQWAKVLSPLSDDYNQAKNGITWNYHVGGATNIQSGIMYGHNELKKARKGLAKVMIIISDGDGQDNRWSRIAAADAAKADDVTIFAFGFNGIQADRMKEISGNKMGTCGAKCNRVASGGLGELTKFIETQLCKTIITVVPPTPAPTPACKVPKASNRPGSAGENKDEEWKDCLGGLCRHFPHANGSSTLCLQKANAGACADPTSPFLPVCSCTCGKCCELTPEPTPAPTDMPTVEPTPMPTDTDAPTVEPTQVPTDPKAKPTPAPTRTESPTSEPTLAPTRSPTPAPTTGPTFPDCEPDFILTLPRASNWLAAKETLVGLFEQCNYDFDPDWLKLIDAYRVKVERNGNFYAYNGPEGIAKEPYEEMTLHICMPTDFQSRRVSVPKCANGEMMMSSANQKLSKAFVLSFGTLLLLLAAKE